MRERVIIIDPEGDTLDVNKDGSINVHLTPSATNPWTVFRTTAAGGEASRVAKAASGTLRDVYAGNVSGALGYLMLFDAAALPANGTVPLLAAVPIANTQEGWYDFGTDGIGFTTGMVVAMSTTQLTLTVVAGGCDFTGRVL